jgi:hypothetical protein
MTIKEGCEAIMHGIFATFNIHLEWLVLLVNITNASNIIFQKVIFEKFCVVGG